MKFEWDARKVIANLKTHGVSFEEAASAFADWRSITLPDPEHSIGEQRFYPSRPLQTWQSAGGLPSLLLALKFESTKTI
jgi:uncharacterized DUF497 family protein